MKLFLLRWLTMTIAVLAAAQLPGIHSESWLSLILAALLLGIVNVMVRPVVLLLSLPLIVLTLGFFILVVNALMLRFVAVMVPGFHVESFWSAFFGAIVISIVSWMAGLLFKDKAGGIQFASYTDRPQIEPEPEIKQANARVVENND
ncbi:MAG: phage holin family protein [Verrucomicrobiota bacterium]